MWSLVRSKSDASHELLKKYNEIILDTTYNLNLQMQRIDDKLANISGESSKLSRSSIDLRDERAVTKQCIRICEDAQSYLEALANNAPSLGQTIVLESAADTEASFEAQLLTNKALDDNRDSFAEIHGRMRERLESLPDGDPTNDRERLRLHLETLSATLEYLSSPTRMCQLQAGCLGRARLVPLFQGQ